MTIFSTIRRAVAGAALGAALAVGPARWRVIRAVWGTLAIAGWASFLVYLVLAGLVALGVLK